MPRLRLAPSGAVSTAPDLPRCLGSAAAAASRPRRPLVCIFVRGLAPWSLIRGSACLSLFRAVGQNHSIPQPDSTCSRYGYQNVNVFWFHPGAFCRGQPPGSLGLHHLRPRRTTSSASARRPGSAERRPALRLVYSLVRGDGPLYVPLHRARLWPRTQRLSCAQPPVLCLRLLSINTVCPRLPSTSSVHSLPWGGA